MPDRLKPCPFCGGNNVGIFKWRTPYGFITYSAQCYDCHFGLVEVDTEAKAIEAWNTRKPMDRIVEQLKEVAFVDWVEKYVDNGEALVCLQDAIEIVKGEVSTDDIQRVKRSNNLQY